MKGKFGLVNAIFQTILSCFALFKELISDIGVKEFGMI
jgi:hypothetical protein